MKHIDMTFEEFQIALKLNDDQRALLTKFLDIAESDAIERTQEGSGIHIYHHSGRTSAYNALGKLVNGIQDDYAYGYFNDTVYVSNCCGAPIDEEQERCKECKEHCSSVTLE